MKKILFFVSLIGLSSVLQAKVDIKSLDIYHNRTFINQKIDLSEKKVNLVNNARFEDIRFIINGTCSVNNASVKVNKDFFDDMSEQIKSLQKDIAYKNSDIKSIENTISSLEGIKFEKDAVSLENIKNIISYTKDEIGKNYNLLFDLKEELKNLNEKLNKLEKNRVPAKHTQLNYDISCDNNSSVYINYPMHYLDRRNSYEINANSKTETIDIINKAFITQRSGFDFENIDINFYTYNYNNQVVPRKFIPEYLDIENVIVSHAPVADALIERKIVLESSKAVKKMPVSSYHETQTKSFFKVSNVTLKNADATSINLSADNYNTTSTLEIDGYSSSNAFYKVEFKSDKLYNPSRTKLYLDSVFISEIFLNEIKKEKKSFVYFGEDRFIDVKKELIKEMKEKPFFSVNKLKTEKLWKYEITNNHNKEKTITLVERVPVSKHEDIKVKLISKTKYDRKDENGKISYDFVIKPNEKKVIEFGYEIEKPYKK